MQSFQNICYCTDDNQQQVSLNNEGQSYLALFVHKPGSCTAFYKWLEAKCRELKTGVMLTFTGVGLCRRNLPYFGDHVEDTTC